MIILLFSFLTTHKIYIRYKNKLLSFHIFTPTAEHLDTINTTSSDTLLYYLV